jgi:integrase
MRVKIDPLVVGLLKEYQSTDGSRAFSFAESYTTYAILGENVNDGLAKFARRIGHEGGLTLYQARHTWATAAYRCGIGKDVINDCLCHVDKAMKVTDIYIAKEWSVLWDANHKVLERFRWP